MLPVTMLQSPICMNLKHKTDINAMAQCMLLDKERDILGSLEVGQAVVKLQGRIAKPFEISIPLFEIEKGKITDTFIKKHMQNIAPIDQQEDFRLPDSQPESALVSEPKNKDETLFAFLKDIQQYHDSGIAQRYKRLGISVRQGQKIKAKVLSQGLIEEQIQTTKTGRIKVISLTEKAETLLSGR